MSLTAAWGTISCDYFTRGVDRPSAKALYEVVPLDGGRDARIKSERLKKAQIKDVAEVRKERRHRDTEARRHQDWDARPSIKIPRHASNQEPSQRIMKLKKNDI